MGRFRNPADATRIRRARIEAGFSQQELAHLGGWPEVTVRRWENATYAPAITNLKRLAALLGVPVASLLVDEDES